MKQYFWSGINKHGQKVKGTTEAYSKQDLKSTLAKQKISIIKIRTCYLTNLFNQKIKQKEISNFLEHLSTLVNSNISIINALIIIQKDTSNHKLKSLISSCIQSISNGNSLYKTVLQHPKEFNQLICSLINVGEQSGTLDIILLKITSHIKKLELQKRKLIKILIYPVAIITTSTIVTMIFLIFIIPQFETMFSNFEAELPIYTQTIIKFSGFLQNSWKIVLCVLATLVLLVKWGKKYSPRFQQLSDKLILNIPFIKNIFIYDILSRSTETISITLKSGIPLVKSLKISKSTISNLQYKMAIDNTISLITSGKNLSLALERQNLFPNQIIQLITIAEETGKLEQTLKKISDIYNERLDATIDNLNKIIEPIIMFILSIIVGGLVIGMYMPIFKLGEII